MLYTNLDNKSLQSIVQQYAIPPITNWSILEGGSENTNYLLETAKQKYILTICERKTFEETTTLVNLLRHLEEHQFKSTTVIPNKKDQNISFFEDKPIILKSYLSGKIIQNLPNQIIEEIGTDISHLHLIPAPDYLPKVYSYGQQVFSDLTTTNINHPFVDWLSEMHVYIKDNLNTTLPKALIHGDIFFSNIIIDQQDTPTIIDFEEACYYYRMYDIGMAIVGLCNQDGIIDFTKASQLIQGYEKIIPIPNSEKDAIQLFIIYAATATAFWRFRQFNIIAPTPSHKDAYLEMKKIADGVRISGSSFTG